MVFLAMIPAALAVVFGLAALPFALVGQSFMEVSVCLAGFAERLVKRMQRP